MDSFLTTTTSLEQRKQSSSLSTKPPKQKKKTTTTTAIKVRYISNPMKVKTCASKFRELVQELTGQDAVDRQPEDMYFQSDDSPPPSTAENLAPRVQFDDVVANNHYKPLDQLDGEEMFLPDQMSAGFSGFFSNGFYNVKEFESIDSM